MMHETISDIFKLLGEHVVSPLVVGMALFAVYKLKDYVQKKRRYKSLKLNIKKNIRIQELLSELRIITGASRTYVSMFHNGNKYINGSPIIKFSRTHETVGPGVSHESTIYQDVLASILMNQDMFGLIDTKEPIVKEVKSLSNSQFKNMLASQGVETFITFPIISVGELVGFLGLDYLARDTHKADLDNKIKEYSISIEQTLSN